MQQITLTLELNQKTIDILQSALNITTGKSAPETEVSTKTTPASKSKPAKKVEVQPEPEVDIPEAEEADEVITMTEVRAEALKLSKAGDQATLKEIFSNYGATKLSDIDAKDYPSLMSDLRAANG